MLRVGSVAVSLSTKYAQLMRLVVLKKFTDSLQESNTLGTCRLAVLLKLAEVFLITVMATNPINQLII